MKDKKRIDEKDHDIIKENIWLWKTLKLVLKILKFIGIAILACVTAWGGMKMQEATGDSTLESPYKQLFSNVLNALSTSLFVYLIFRFFKEIRDNKARKKELENTILDCLGVHAEILDGHNKEQIDRILQRCITFYNKDIAQQFQEYVKANLDVFRKNFEYNIDILENGTDDKTVKIRQYLSYDRCFKVPHNRATYELRCYFSTSNDLDKQLSVNSLFFREELTLDSLRKDIDSIKEDINNCSNKKSEEYRKHKQRLIEVIGLQMFLGEKSTTPINNDDINVEINEQGILFFTKIPKDYITESRSISGDKYASYHGKIICTYKANINNQFYCIFSNITIGATRFTLTFSENVFRNLKNKNKDEWKKRVKTISMLSMKDKENLPDIDIRENQTIAFTAKEGDVIFPRSGFVITWNPLHNIEE